MNYSQVSGVQTAFDPDPGWTFLFGLWNCQPSALPIIVPQPPFGPDSGTIQLTFDCLDRNTLAVLGRMFFIAQSGCLHQTYSSRPLGTHAVDCQQGIDQIHPGEGYRLGRICVGQGGYDPCFVMPAVEGATWGEGRSRGIASRPPLTSPYKEDRRELVDQAERSPRGRSARAWRAPSGRGRQESALHAAAPRQGVES